LLTAFIIVMLLNIVLMLLPTVIKYDHTPEPVEGRDHPRETESNISQNIPNPSNITTNNTDTNKNSQHSHNDTDFEKYSIPSTLPPAPTVSIPEANNSGADSTPSSDDVSKDANTPEEHSDSVTLCLMGDLMCLAGQQYTAERRDGTHDYTGSFHLVRDFFSSCDFVIGNLETTLSESNPYSTKEREVNEQPNCNAPADYLASLTWAGITHLVTANNHSLDGGLVGIEETVAHLDEYGIPHTGTYRSDYNGAHYMMLEKNGIRIAILSFTELINQRTLLTASQLARMIDSYSKKDIAKRIAQARADGADFVVVYAHWGSENVHEVRDYQKAHAKEIAAAGADLIIGSHPHCLQEMEYIVTEDGKSVPCFYSLGNVVSSMTRDINHDTVFVQVSLRSNKEANSVYNSVSITSLSLLPCHVLTALDGHYRVITPLDYKTGDKKITEELARAKARIEEIFAPHGNTPESESQRH
ncbi:MAG: CapA family protein, partial [Lachnospiraceae bacterium]|nr:CapA family protein [Lachnospiraceae bacterium]